MVDEKKKSTPIALIVSSIAAILVIAWLSFYKPIRKDTFDPDSNLATPVEVDDALEPDVELDVEIVVAEYRENNYYVQVQTNDAFNGVCVFSLVSVDDGQIIEHEAKLEPADRVSNCENSFLLKELHSGDYELKVSVTTKNNKTKVVSRKITILED